MAVLFSRWYNARPACEVERMAPPWQFYPGRAGHQGTSLMECPSGCMPLRGLLFWLHRSVWIRRPAFATCRRRSGDLCATSGRACRHHTQLCERSAPGQLLATLRNSWLGPALAQCSAALPYAEQARHMDPKEPVRSPLSATPGYGAWVRSEQTRACANWLQAELCVR